MAEVVKGLGCQPAKREGGGKIEMIKPRFELRTGWRKGKSSCLRIRAFLPAILINARHELLGMAKWARAADSD